MELVMFTRFFGRFATRHVLSVLCLFSLSTQLGSADDVSVSQDLNTRQQEASKLLVQKKYKEAEAKFRELVPLARRNPGPQRLSLITALQGLAEALRQEDRLSDSFKFTQEANTLAAEELKKTGLAPAGAGLQALTNAAGNNLHAYEAKNGSLNNSMKLAQESSIKANMRTTQIVAESYATDFHKYPVRFDVAVQSYFPDGSNDGKRAGRSFANPFTGKQEWPIFGSGSKPSAGSVIYVSSPDGKAYSIYGVGGDGHYLLGKDGQRMVLSGHL
jgi:hypothetical protein